MMTTYRLVIVCLFALVPCLPINNGITSQLDLHTSSIPQEHTRVSQSTPKITQVISSKSLVLEALIARPWERIARVHTDIIPLPSRHSLKTRIIAAMQDLSTLTEKKSYLKSAIRTVEKRIAHLENIVMSILVNWYFWNQNRL